MKKSFSTLITVTFMFLIVFTFHPRVVFADEGTPTTEETTSVEETETPPPKKNSRETITVDESEQGQETDTTDGEASTPAGEGVQDETQGVNMPEQSETPPASPVPMEDAGLVSSPEQAEATPEQSEPSENTQSINTPEKSETPSTQTESPEEAETATATEQSEATEEASTPSVAEVLDQAPEGTKLVVLDSAGQEEPLATQEAANIVNSGDPMWCPSGALPGSATCSGSYNIFENLLVDLGNFAGDGTIYVANTYDSSLESSDIAIDGNVYSNLGALTFQGGWDGNLGSVNIVGTSTFTGVSLAMTNWGGNVILNDIILNATDNGLAVDTTGSVALNNVDVTNTLYSDGITIASGGNVTLTNVTSSSNDSSGAVINSGGSVSIQSSSFDNNGPGNTYGLGLDVDATGEINISNSTVTGNAEGGALLNSDSDITLNNSNFNNNAVTATSSGIDAKADGNITLSNVNANSNSEYGAVLTSKDSVSVTNSTFSGNTGAGYSAGLEITAPKTIQLNSVVANNNGNDGIALYDSPDIILQNVTAANNGWSGVYVEANCTVVQALNGIFSGNGHYGIDVTTGKLNLSGSVFSNNQLGYISVDDGGCFVVGSRKSVIPFSGPNEELLWHIISVKDGDSNDLDCEHYIGTILVLENGDRVKLPCPIKDTGILLRVSSQNLPGTLPSDYHYISGMNLNVIGAGTSLETLDTAATISFYTNGSNTNFSILYWNGSQWLELTTHGNQDSIVFGSGKLLIWNGAEWTDVIPAGKQVVGQTGNISSEGYFESVLNFTGTFILAEK